jgi:hypothetical protein
MKQRLPKFRLVDGAVFLDPSEEPVLTDLIDIVQLTFLDTLGIEGIDVICHSAKLDGDDIIADLELDPQEYITQSIAYGEDIFEILQTLKEAGLSSDTLKSLISWIQDKPEFKVAMLNTEDGISIDQWPVELKL